MERALSWRCQYIHPPIYIFVNMSISLLKHTSEMSFKKKGYKVGPDVGILPNFLLLMPKDDVLKFCWLQAHEHDKFDSFCSPVLGKSRSFSWILIGPSHLSGITPRLLKVSNLVDFAAFLYLHNLLLLPRSTTLHTRAPSHFQSNPLQSEPSARLARCFIGFPLFLHRTYKAQLRGSVVEKSSVQPAREDRAEWEALYSFSAIILI